MNICENCGNELKEGLCGICGSIHLDGEVFTPQIIKWIKEADDLWEVTSSIHLQKWFKQIQTGDWVAYDGIEGNQGKMSND